MQEFARRAPRRLPGAAGRTGDEGRRSIEFGAAWFIGGLLVAVVTFGQARGEGVYFVVWVPMFYGVHRIVSGLQLVRKSRELS